MAKIKLNSYTVVIYLIIASNVLELFLPRMDDEKSFLRLPIQMINGSSLVIMGYTILTTKNSLNRINQAVTAFLFLLLIHSLFYLVSDNFSLSKLSPYIRFSVWLISIMFFYNRISKFGVNYNLFRVYVLTYIVGIAKHLLESDKLEREKVGGGDTASLALLFILPLVLLLFDSNYKILLLGFISLMILFSLRRTTIVGFAICIPFFFKDIKATIKPRYLIFLAVFFIGIFIFTWERIGAALMIRFQELYLGDGGGAKESFGSGRSNFYAIVWNNWWDGDIFSIIFGNGLSSVNTMLMKEYGLGHAHNDFLEIGYTFGLLGIAMWFYFLFELWKLRKRIKIVNPKYSNLFYMTFLSYIIIALASGCILRMTTLPFGIAVSILLAAAFKRKDSIKGFAPVQNITPKNLLNITQ